MDFEHNVERIDYDEISLETFREKYEKPNKPVIISNSLVSFENHFNFSFKVRLNNQRIYTKLLEKD